MIGAGIGYIASLLPFYALGAFPTGHLIARSRGVEIEQHGSGNVGATNVLRTLGKKAGALTFGGDFLKGAAAVSIASLISSDGAYTAAAGLAAVLGHCISIPGKLRGGKGVATAFGVFAVQCPLAAVIGLAAFGAALGLGRMVSLASIVGALAAPLSALLIGAPDSELPALGAIGLLVVVRHRANIQRITEGREPRIGAAVKGAPHTEDSPEHPNESGA